MNALNMQRRTVLKNVVLTAGGLLSLPAWANAWSASTLGTNLRLFKGNEAELLAEIVETIIPETTTPGAKALQIQTFVMRMVQDCYSPADQSLFANGLETVDKMAQQTYQKNFVACDKTQRLALLTELSRSEDAANARFFGMTKDLTISGYLNSEYVMTNLTDFEFAPARYHGCVPIKK